MLSRSSKNEGTLRGAVVGYGFISSHGHIPAYVQRMHRNRDVQILVIVDSCEARRVLAQESLKELLPGVRFYSDYRAMLEREASNLDFVDICTPPCWHGEIALAALNQGLHVLCEKPLTTSTAEATALIQKAIQSERVVFPCHNYKHAPVVQTIRDIIQSGEIGRVRSVTLNTFRNTHAKGVDEWKKHWRREKKYSGGGIAMDHGSHTFYLAFDWMGAYPTAITAKMSNLMPHLYDTEDNLTAVLTFPEGLVHAHLSWTAGVRKVIYTIQGESGAITVDDDELQLALIQKTDSPDVAQGAVSWKVQKKSIVSNWMDASHVQWFDAMFQQFKTAIQRNDYVSKDTYDSFFCIEAITAAYRSAETGCLEVALSQGHGTRGA